MPKRSSMPKDLNQLAASIVSQTTGQPVPSQASVSQKPMKNPAAVALGRLGGIKGGRARAEKLTKAQRSKIAAQAAVARWSKKRG